MLLNFVLAVSFRVAFLRFSLIFYFPLALHFGCCFVFWRGAFYRFAWPQGEAQRHNNAKRKKRNNEKRQQKKREKKTKKSLQIALYRMTFFHVTRLFFIFLRDR